MQDLNRYECYVYIAHADVGHLEIHVTGRKTRLRSELLTGMLLESQGSAGRQLLHKFKIYVFCCCRCRRCCCCCCCCRCRCGCCCCCCCRCCRCCRCRCRCCCCCCCCSCCCWLMSESFYFILTCLNWIVSLCTYYVHLFLWLFATRCLLRIKKCFLPIMPWGCLCILWHPLDPNRRHFKLSPNAWRYIISHFLYISGRLVATPFWVHI